MTLARSGAQPDRPIGVTDSQLAVLLRQTQWALDDAAHDFPAGRVSAARRAELAGTLEALAAIVRASTPGGMFVDAERSPKHSPSVTNDDVA